MQPVKRLLTGFVVSGKVFWQSLNVVEIMNLDEIILKCKFQ